MKQPIGPTQRLFMAQSRQKQLVAACGPVWAFNLAVHVGCIARSVLTLVLRRHGLLGTAAEVVLAAASAATLAPPAAVIHLKRPDMIQAACVIASVANSVLLWLMGSGITLFPASARGVLATHGETIVDLVMAYQCQLSLPIMAILHAFRQAAWMSIILWRMDGDLNRLLVRGCGNWTLMMLFSAFLELRLRAAHQKACRDMQQQQEQQGQQKQQAQQPGASCGHPQLLDGIDDSVNETMSVPKPQSCSGAASKSDADYTRRRHSTDGPVEGEATDSGAPVDASVTLAGALPDKVTAHPQLLSGGAEVQLPVPAVPATARRARGMSVLPGVRQVQPTVDQQQAAQAVLRAIQSKQHASSYKRSRLDGSDTVHVKVEGIELEHLPPDLPELLHKQLSDCMPGVTMTGLALRSGCVMLTLDLMRYEEEGTAALSANGMQDLITHLMQSQAMGQVLEDGAPMCIQMPDELALCRWDSARSSYTSAGAPALDSADGYSCRMVSAGPAVHCLSGNGSHTPQRSGSLPGTPTSRQLTLTVVVELPSNCQLHGWQPADAAAPAGSGGLLQDLSQDGPVLDAMLLTRRLDGGYLPVVVQRLPCVGNDSRDVTTHQITAQVLVSVAGEGPAALHLELWCKQADAAGRAVGGTDNQLSWVPGHMPELELLVAHMPLLVLPGSCKEAATELQQHIDEIGSMQPQHALPLASNSAISPSSTIKYSTPDLGHDTGTRNGMPPAASQPVMNQSQTASGQPMQHHRSPKGSDSASSHTPAHSHPHSNDCEYDPVCCLLEDLGVLLTYQPTAGNKLAAVPDDVISQLGDDLLVYAVQHALASVASVIVDTMQRIEQHGAASMAAQPAIVSPSAWLTRVAGCASTGNRDGLPGGNEGHLSLLHAAMASGSAEMLGHVFRWGTLYGGRDWAWPWELEDETGCTALHVAAAQPAAGACAALLKTITCMLSAVQVQAARNAWLHCQGGLGSTPAQLFALASSGGYAGEMWSNETPVHSSGNTNSTQPGSTIESMRAGPSAASPSGLPQATTASTSHQPSKQSWLGSMVEVWTSREPQEYHAWAKHQDSLSIWYWAAALFVISAAAMHRSAIAGCLQYEWPHITLYSLFMIPAVVATAGGVEWLGGTTVWMVLAQVLPICSWVVRFRLLSHQAPVWILAVNTGADVMYVVLVGVAIDKIPMPQLVLSRTIEAIAQSYAAKTAGFAHPLLRALGMHITVLVASMVTRTRKLRAFYRWQARQQELRHSLPSDRKREDAGKQ